jgi:hypothetical protein
LSISSGQGQAYTNSNNNCVDDQHHNHSSPTQTPAQAQTLATSLPKYEELHAVVQVESQTTSLSPRQLEVQNAAEYFKKCQADGKALLKELTVAMIQVPKRNPIVNGTGTYCVLISFYFLCINWAGTLLFV